MKVKYIQVLYVLVYKAEDVWKDSIHPTVDVPMIYNTTESLFLHLSLEGFEQGI